MRNKNLLTGVFLALWLSVPMTSTADTTVADVDVGAKCGQCHDMADPAGQASEDWIRRLAAIGSADRLSPEEQTEVLGFLRHHGWETTQLVAMAADRHLFDEKCSLCHSANRVFLEALDEAALRGVVERMRQREPRWISPGEADRIVRFLLDEAPGVRKPAHLALDGAPAHELYRVRCSGCHNLERVYLYLEATAGTSLSWGPMVERMRQKAPGWMSEDEAAKILAYLRSIQPVMR